MGIDDDIKEMEKEEAKLGAGKALTITDLRRKLLRAVHANLLMAYRRRVAGADTVEWKGWQSRGEAFGDCLALIKPGWTLGCVEIKTCAAPDCDVVFIPTGRGRYSRMYHASRCQNRHFMQKRRARGGRISG